MIFQGSIYWEDQDLNAYPLQGVNVFFPELTEKGTVTNQDGNFYFNSSLINDNTKVVFSFVGFNTINTTVGKFNNRSFPMFEADNMLQENELIGISKKSKFCWWCLIIPASIALYIYNKTE